MNQLEATVVKIDGEPFENFGKWWVECCVESWGRESENTVMFDTKKQAEAFKSRSI